MKTRHWIGAIVLSLAAMYFNDRAKKAKSRGVRTLDLVAADIASVSANFV